jgi:hypothetical protein
LAVITAAINFFALLDKAHGKKNIFIPVGMPLKKVRRDGKNLPSPTHLEISNTPAVKKQPKQTRLHSIIETEVNQCYTVIA